MYLPCLPYHLKPVSLIETQATLCRTLFRPPCILRGKQVGRRDDSTGRIGGSYPGVIPVQLFVLQ